MATGCTGFARMADFDPFRCRQAPVEDLCSRLIQVSVEKIVSSKHERGGAKLHKNLLILHLLKTARTQQHRSGSPTELSPPYSNSPFFAEPELPQNVEIEEETIYLSDISQDHQEHHSHQVVKEVEMVEASSSVPFTYTLSFPPTDTGSEESPVPSPQLSPPSESLPLRQRRSLSSGYESSPESGSSGSSSEDEEAPSSPESTSSDESRGKRKRKRPSQDEEGEKRTRPDMTSDSYAGDRLQRLISVFNSVELFPPQPDGIESPA